MTFRRGNVHRGLNSPSVTLNTHNKITCDMAWVLNILVQNYEIKVRRDVVSVR